MPAPEAIVVGNGFQSFQDAVDIYRKGVFAQKAVTSL